MRARIRRQVLTYSTAHNLLTRRVVLLPHIIEHVLEVPLRETLLGVLVPVVVPREAKDVRYGKYRIGFLIP